MRVELSNPDRPDEILGEARWDGREVQVAEAGDDVMRLLARIFRRSPVSVDDLSSGQGATRAARVVEPGDLEWFRQAALVRGREEGLAVRFVTDRTRGWDPAGTYRPLGAIEGATVATGTSRA